MPDLKPCPFCGKSVATLSTALELEDCLDFEDDDRCPACMDWAGSCGYHTVVCGITDGGCGASSGYYPSKEKAIAAWNRRSSDAVTVIRCSECQYYEKRCPSEDIGWCNRPGVGCGQPEEFWCAGAKRKENENE